MDVWKAFFHLSEGKKVEGGGRILREERQDRGGKGVSLLKRTRWARGVCRDQLNLGGAFRLNGGRRGGILWGSLILEAREKNTQGSGCPRVEVGKSKGRRSAPKKGGNVYFFHERRFAGQKNRPPE